MQLTDIVVKKLGHPGRHTVVPDSCGLPPLRLSYVIFMQLPLRWPLSSARRMI